MFVETVEGMGMIMKAFMSATLAKLQGSGAITLTKIMRKCGKKR